MRRAWLRKILIPIQIYVEQASIWFTALSRASITDPETHEWKYCKCCFSKPLGFWGRMFVMQQHHSISWLIQEGNLHLLRTQSLPNTIYISCFNLQNFLLRYNNALREGKDPQLISGWARNSNSHVPMSKYSDYFMAFPHLTAVYTTGDNNNNLKIILLFDESP